MLKDKNIYKENIFFLLLIGICLGNVFYIPVAYTDRFFTSGMLWLGCSVTVFALAWLILGRGSIRLPLTSISMLGLIIVYGLYGWIGEHFSCQQLAFLLTLWWLMVMVANSSGKISAEHISVIITGMAVVEAAYALGQHLGWGEIYNLNFPVTGSFDNPAGLSCYLAMSLPFVLPFVLSQRKWKQAGGIATVALITTAILLSGSRTGIVATLVAASCTIIGSLHLSQRMIRRLAVVCCVGGLFFMAGLYFMKKDSADGRLLIWRCTWEMIREKPLWGHGPGSFGGAYMPCQAHYLAEHPDERKEQLAGNVKHPFNEYLRLWAEYGLMGLVIISSVVGNLVRIKNAADPAIRPAKISLLALAICGLFSYPLNYPAVWALSAISAGLLLRPTKAFELNSWSWLGAGILCVLLLLGYIVYWKKAEHCWYRLSQHAWTKEANVLPDYARLYPFIRENPLFLYNYGAELHEQQLWAESIARLRECSRQLNDSDVQLLLADSYFQQGDYRHAEECLTLASQMYPALFLPLYQLVELYRTTGRKDEALRLARIIVEKTVKVPSYTVEKIKKEMRDYLSETKK